MTFIRRLPKKGKPKTKQNKTQQLDVSNVENEVGTELRYISCNKSSEILPVVQQFLNAYYKMLILSLLLRSQN